MSLHNVIVDKIPQPLRHIDIRGGGGYSGALKGVRGSGFYTLFKMHMPCLPKEKGLKQSVL